MTRRHPLLGKRRVEVFGNRKNPSIDAEAALRASIDRHQLCYGLTSLRDGDLLTGCHPAQEFGQVSLGFVNVDFHKARMD